jgi:hypothetical protein
LQARPLNLDVLQLYTLLMGFLAPVLWLMLRKPDLMMVGSLLLYFLARYFEWNFASFPDGDWYFNPFCWQLLFVFGAWLALGGAKRLDPILKSSLLFYLGIAYLAFALAMTMAGRFPAYGQTLPTWLFDAFNPNDKVNLAPYRVLHFVVVVFVVTLFVTRDSPALKSPVLTPLVKCGEQSLAVFCVGVFLSFVGHIALMLSSGSIMAQIAVGLGGIAIMTFVGYYISWSKQQDAWKTLAHA